MTRKAAASSMATAATTAVVRSAQSIARATGLSAVMRKVAVSTAAVCEVGRRHHSR